MPHHNGGCLTCKIRRIKCDGGQPACQNCLRSTRTCSGTKPVQAGFVVHLENSYASGQKKRPRGPRSIPTTKPMDKSEIVLQPSFVDLNTQAIAYYIHYHMQRLTDAPGVLKGVADDFLPLWKSNSDSTMLDLGLSSLALAVYSRKQHNPLAAREASLKYHQLLRTAQTMFQTLNEDNIDIHLLAIFFMSRYEDAIHQSSQTNQIPVVMKVQSFRHHDGALAVLKFWKDSLSHRHPASTVIKRTRQAMIRSALLRNLALPQWLWDGAAFGEEGLDLLYDRLMVQILDLRRRISNLLQNKDNSDCELTNFTSIVEDLSKEAQEIDRELQNWTSHFPSTWFYRRHTLPDSLDWPTRDFFSPVVYSYSSPAYAAVWCKYYATRMLINSTRLKTIEFSLPSTNDFAYKQRLDCLSNMKDLANDMASCLPYCMQKFQVDDSPGTSPHQSSLTLNPNEDLKPSVASMVAWPLGIVVALENFDIKQRLWFKSQLAGIGKLLGIGILECADNDEWLEF